MSDFHIFPLKPTILTFHLEHTEGMFSFWFCTLYTQRGSAELFFTKGTPMDILGWISTSGDQGNFQHLDCLLRKDEGELPDLVIDRGITNAIALSWSFYEGNATQM